MRLIYTQLTSTDLCRKNKDSGKHNKNIKQNFKKLISRFWNTNYFQTYNGTKAEIEVR